MTGLPLNSTSPLVGASRPAIRLMRVVLPVPEKPRSTRNSPSFTSRSMSLRTSVLRVPSLKLFETFSNLRMLIKVSFRAIASLLERWFYCAIASLLER